MGIQRESCPMLSSYKLLVLLAHRKYTLCLTYISCLCGSWDKDQNPQHDLIHNPVYLSGLNIPPLHHSVLSHIDLHPVSEGTLFLPALKIRLCFFLCPGATFPFYCVLTFQLKHHFPQIGQLHGLATWAVAQGLHLEGLHAWFNVLLSQSWNSFEQRASHFHFALGHRNHVASSILREASADLPK